MEQSLQNSQQLHESECDRCKRIDQQCEEQQFVQYILHQLSLFSYFDHIAKASDRLRANNVDLKQKIEMIQVVLNEKLDSLKQKKNTTLNLTNSKVDRMNDPLRRELEEEHKRLEQIQRSVKTLEEKQQMNQNVQRIADMKNEITDKQNQLYKLRRDNKLLEDIKLHNQAILAQRDEFQEIKDLEEEVIGLKGLLRDIRMNDRKIEKDMTKQCQYLIAIEQKHKEVCEHFGISPSLNQTRFDNLQDLIADNLRNKQLRQKREESQRIDKIGKIEVTEESYKQILEELKLKKAQKAEIEAEHKRESDEVTAKIRQANFERDSLLLKLRDKDKELNIAIMKINELKRLTKHNALKPLNVVSESPLKSNRAEFAIIPKRRRDIRREQGGVSVGTETACSWDNSNELPDEKDYQITEVRVLFDEEQIKGLSVVYKLRNGERVELECFAPDSEQAVKPLSERVLKLRGPESIASVSGFYNNFFIEYLRIVSSRGNYIMAGSDKNQARCKRFDCEVKKDERPISFFGIVDRISFRKYGEPEGDEPADMTLTSIGIELKKRDNPNSIRSQMIGDIKRSSLNNLEVDENKLYSSTLVREVRSVTNKTLSKRRVINALSPQNYYSSSNLEFAGESRAPSNRFAPADYSQQFQSLQES